MKQRLLISDVVSICKKVLIGAGMDSDDAQVVINHLLDGELAGHSSHGFYRIPGIVNALKNKGERTEISIEKELDNSFLINGGSHQGLVVAYRMVEKMLQKIPLTSIVVAGARNYLGTTGSIGYYTRLIADAGYIGIMMTNSAASIPPHGGLTPIFGTNPISVSIPSNDEPIVVDFASSKWSYGDIALAIKEGRRIPEGVVLDKDGNPSTDPNDADYAMLPIGGHKGYALALAIEVLAGPLVGAKAGESVPGSDGLVLIAINPSTFVAPEIFRTQISTLIDEIKSAKKLNNVDEIYYPGEKSNRTRKINTKLDHIDIIDSIWTDILNLASNQGKIGESYY